MGDGLVEMVEIKRGRVVVGHEFDEFIDLFFVFEEGVEGVLVVVETDEGGNHDTMAESQAGVAPGSGGTDGLELQRVEV